MSYNIKIKSLLKFTNLLVKKGKKSKASSIFLKTLFLLKKKTKKNPINFLYSAIKSLTPGVSTKKTVVAGRLYNLPCAITSSKALYFGCNWLQQSAITSKEGKKSLKLSEKLALECFKVLKKKGNAILFLKQHNKIVSDNRPFLRFVKRKRSVRLPRKVFLRRRRILFLKRKFKKIPLKYKDSFHFKLDSSGKAKKISYLNNKVENKFQSKLDSKFIKIDKKRSFSFRINLIKKRKKNDPNYKSNPRSRSRTKVRQKSKKYKIKKVNKKN